MEYLQINRQENSWLIIDTSTSGYEIFLPYSCFIYPRNIHSQPSCNHYDENNQYSDTLHLHPDRLHDNIATVLFVLAEAKSLITLGVNRDHRWFRP
jgi:hypothetical protein